MSRILSIGRPAFAAFALLILAACSASEAARIQLAAEPERMSAAAV